MDVRLLEAFRAVVDHRTVTNAATSLGVTQPAVSAQIARLEQELGFLLFERGNGRLKPTPEGLLFYAEASKALTGIDRLAQAALQIRTAQVGHLIIASHPSAAISLLPPIISAFLAQRPGVLVRLVSRNSDVISRLLPSQSYDIGIAELPVDESAVKVTRFRLRCVGVLPPGHPLQAHKRLFPALLAPHPVVALAPTLQTALRLKTTFAEAGVELSPVAEAEYFATLCGLVASGAGWSLVDPLSSQTFQHLGLTVRPFDPAIYYEIGAFSAREREPSILAQAFLALLSDKLSTLGTSDLDPSGLT
jgi:DNA-binding transcriptional LysR family regulator